MKIRYTVPFPEAHVRFAVHSSEALGQSDIVLKIGFDGYEPDRDMARELGLPFSESLQSSYLYNPESPVPAVVTTKFFKLPAHCDALTLELIPWHRKTEPSYISDVYLHVAAPFDGFKKVVLKGSRVE